MDGITLDKAQVDAAFAKLRSYSGPEMAKRQRKATLAAAQQVKRDVQAAAPRKTGRLAASFRLSAINLGGRWIGYRIKASHNSPTNLESLVVGGTKAHTIHALPGGALATPSGPVAVVRSPGTRARPFVARVYESDRARISALMAEQLLR